VVITGGTKGLGRALAEQYIAKGYSVIICAREKDEVETVAKEIGALPFVADVTKEADMKALADFAVSSFGQIDIWINNAGVWMPHASVEQLDIERVRKLFEVNVFGAMSGSKYALAQMREQGKGTIISIISESGLVGHPLSSGYAASKWAVRGFAESLRAECKDSAIRVISVYPSYMKTDLFHEQKPEDLENYMSPESVAQKIIENVEQTNPQTELIIKQS
jgi:short-subunit dehydrogenase